MGAAPGLLPPRGTLQKWELRTYFLCCAEERLVQMTATTATTTTVMTPTVTTMMTRRLLFFWGVTLPWGGCICPMGGSDGKDNEGMVSAGFAPLPLQESPLNQKT